MSAGQPWAVDAACATVGAELWFGEEHEGKRTTVAARRICREVCPVRVDCLGYAVATGQEFGVWGGLTAMERRPLVRLLKRSAA